ncbi:MAG: SigE family polymerase sigma factor [Frankiales bacterium]|nr:SigE family polymerase sigma factor [Frankiales bacterium]
MRDEQSFDELVEACSPRLLRTAWLLTGDPQLAEDLLQTALAATYLRWGRLRDTGAGEAYVRKVMATTASRWWRRKWHGERPTDVLPEHPAADPGFDAVDERQALRSALAQLPARQRACVVLRFSEDLSEAQVADALDCSVGTVKSATSRGLARLRAALGEEAASWALP